MKPWIAKETAAKVTIMGSDYKSKLLEFIDEEALPARLGGKCTCDGLGGCMKSNAGPWMHKRKERREAWLNGERETIAILPGELHGTAPVRSEKLSDEVAADATVRPSSSGTSASDSSSVETSSIATPPSSDHGEHQGDASPQKNSVEVTMRDVYQSETTRVQTGDLHKERTSIAAS